jgi:hypothetical protein
MSRKLFFKFKYLKLELGETKEKNDEYNAEFMSDFQEEIEYLNSINVEETPKNNTDAQGDVVSPSHKNNLNYPQEFKEIYRELIKNLHPDLKPEIEKKKYEELLKTVTRAYEKQEWFELINIAELNGIKIPDFSESYNEEFENNLKKLETDILMMKNKLCWVWMSKLKPDNRSKEDAYRLMNIDIEKFNEWKKNKNQ